jgi:hypothetical protein
VLHNRVGDPASKPSVDLGDGQADMRLHEVFQR